MKVTSKQASQMIPDFIKARIVPMLTGSPGIGKSAIVRAIAATYSLKVIDLRLSQCDPTDLNGFPSIIGARAGYRPMDTFPIEGDPIPEGYAGWLLFLDEFNSAALAVQAAAYKLILDRMVGQHALHANLAIVCAGNLETDNAIVQPMSTAMQSRLAHMELVVDVNEFIEYAQKASWHHYITDHISFKPGNLYTFMPDHTDNTYACPRTWEFVDRLIKIRGLKDELILPTLASVISEGVAREFITYCEIYESLPKREQLINSPETIVIPQEKSILYALTGTISHNATKDNFSQLYKAVKRLPVEFQAVTMRETIRRNKSLLGHALVQKWIADTAIALF